MIDRLNLAQTLSNFSFHIQRQMALQQICMKTRAPLLMNETNQRDSLFVKSLFLKYSYLKIAKSDSEINMFPLTEQQNLKYYTLDFLQHLLQILIILKFKF